MQLEDADGGQLFGGLITEALHSSIGELCEYEKTAGKVLIKTFA